MSSNKHLDKDDFETRFLLRKKLRSILSRLQSEKDLLKEDLKDNNKHFQKIFEEVRNICHEEMGDHVRELNLDAAIALELANILKLQVLSLAEISKSYNLSRFLDGVRRSSNSPAGSINWSALGAMVASTWCCGGAMLTMHGPVKKQEKERTRKVTEKQSKEVDAKPAEKAENIEQEKEDADNDEATNRRVVRLLDHLEERTDKSVDLLRLLVDPRDPVQTVENFFDFSFLVKEQKVGVYLDQDTKLPVMNMVDRAKMPDAKRQMVISLDMKDLEKLPELLYEEPEPHHPLHREDEIYTTTDVYKQAEIQSKNKRSRGGDVEKDSTTKKKRK